MGSKHDMNIVVQWVKLLRTQIMKGIHILCHLTNRYDIYLL